MIGLAGSVASGKTVYLCSLMMNGFDVMQRQNLTVRNAYGNPNDDYKIEMERNATVLCGMESVRSQQVRLLKNRYFWK